MLGPAGDLDVERAALLAGEDAPSDDFVPEVRLLSRLCLTLLASRVRPTKAHLGFPHCPQVQQSCRWESSPLLFFDCQHLRRSLALKASSCSCS